MSDLPRTMNDTTDEQWRERLPAMARPPWIRPFVSP